MFDYDFSGALHARNKLDIEKLIEPLLQAERGMARIGERLRNFPHREGVLERLIYREASATSLLGGKLVPVEDLIESDHGIMRKIPYLELADCFGIYHVLRHAARAESVEKLLGADRAGEQDPDKDAEGFYERDRDVKGRREAWNQVRRDVEDQPALVAAALIWGA